MRKNSITTRKILSRSVRLVQKERKGNIMENFAGNRKGFLYPYFPIERILFKEATPYSMSEHCRYLAQQNEFKPFKKPT